MTAWTLDELNAIWQSARVPIPWAEISDLQMRQLVHHIWSHSYWSDDIIRGFDATEDPGVATMDHYEGYLAGWLAIRGNPTIIYGDLYRQGRECGRRHSAAIRGLDDPKPDEVVDWTLS